MKIELNKLVDGLYYFSTLLRKGYTCTKKLMERNPAPVEVGSWIPLFTRLYTSEVVGLGISSVNSTILQEVGIIIPISCREARQLMAYLCQGPTTEEGLARDTQHRAWMCFCCSKIVWVLVCLPDLVTL